MASPSVQTLVSATPRMVVNIPVVDNAMVQRAFQFLTNRRVSQSEEHFVISTETIDHDDMKEYVSLLCDQYKNADEDVRGYLNRLQFNKEGTQLAKAIIVGTRNEFSISLVATNRTITDGRDTHKILIATMKKKVEMSAAWNLFAKIFGIKSSEQKELESIISKLNGEDIKKCLEAMVVYTLAEKIQQFLGSNVEVRFIENSTN